MKSIKEKSNEYAKEYLFSSIQRTPNIHFEAGANYVLDHLSKTIAVSSDGYLRDNLKKMIEQLKK